MRRKIFITGISIFLILFLIGVPSVFADQSCEPCTHKIGDSSKDVIEQTYYFSGCEFGENRLEYCEYPLIKKKYTCKTVCKKYCIDPIEYKKCGTEGCNSGSFTIEGRPCGSDYTDGEWTTTSSETIDTSGWTCPAAKILAKLYTPDPLSLNFGKISAGGKHSNSVLRGGENNSFYFTANIPACINRIPMLNLKVKLKNETEVVRKEHGIYTKHQTISYGEDEKSGMIEDFEIPKQKEFKKEYTLKSSLKGYKAWAWRQQLVEAIEKITDIETDWNDLPEGIPTEPKKVGDLYFSKDFIAPLAVGEGASCTGTVEDSVSCTIETYSLDLSTDGNMCSYQDLISYKSGNGLTDSLVNKIRSNCNISTDSDIEDATIEGLTSYVLVAGNIKKENVDVSNYFGIGITGNKTDTINKERVNVTKIFGKNNSEFKEYAENQSNYNSVFNTLFSNDVITDDELRSLTGIQNDYFFNYDTTVNKIEVPTLYSDNQSVEIELEFNISWTTTGMKNSKFVDYASNSDNYLNIYNTLHDNEIITDSELEELITDYIEGFATKADCTSYTPSYTFKNVNDITTSNLQGENKVDISLNLSLNWTADIDAEINVETKFTYNCDEGWTWGNISELSTTALAKCLYNFDKCLKRKKDGYYEIAAAGYGPHEAYPTLENERSFTDGGLGEESKTTTVTVYRPCGSNDKWISLNGRYTCPRKIYTKGSGELEKETGSGEYLVIKNGTNVEAKKLDRIKVNNSLSVNSMEYDYDVNEGDQYYVLKCAYNPSVDEESTLAIKAEIGTIVELGDDKFYICQKEGWTSIS